MLRVFRIRGFSHYHVRFSPDFNLASLEAFDDTSNGYLFVWLDPESCVRVLITLEDGFVLASNARWTRLCWAIKPCVSQLMLHDSIM